MPFSLQSDSLTKCIRLSGNLPHRVCRQVPFVMCLCLVCEGFLCDRLLPPALGRGVGGLCVHSRVSTNARYEIPAQRFSKAYSWSLKNWRNLDPERGFQLENSRPMEAWQGVCHSSVIYPALASAVTAEGYRMESLSVWVWRGHPVPLCSDGCPRLITYPPHHLGRLLGSLNSVISLIRKKKKS